MNNKTLSHFHSFLKCNFVNFKSFKSLYPYSIFSQVNIHYSKMARYYMPFSFTSACQPKMGEVPVFRKNKCIQPAKF